MRIRQKLLAGAGRVAGQLEPRRFSTAAPSSYYSLYRHHSPRLSTQWHQSPLCPPPCLFALRRGKKTKTTVLFDDLPQGLLPHEPLPLEEDALPTYPKVVQQARENMHRFGNCVLLTRVGGFYELYFEHAEEFGPLLNLKVAQKRTNAGAVSMASRAKYF